MDKLVALERRTGVRIGPKACESSRARLVARVEEFASNVGVDELDVVLDAATRDIEGLAARTAVAGKEHL